jgi:hypothetical protein
MKFRRLVATLVFPASLIAVTVVFASGCAARRDHRRAGSSSTAFSGYELFPGFEKRISKTTVSCHGTSVTTSTAMIGTTFAASTVPAGGVVSGSVNYLGSPGLGQGGSTNTVCITGGTWSWQQPEATYFGKVENGFVTWPPSGETLSPNPNNCGKNVAEFNASVSVSNVRGTGTITGCLNDQNNLIPPPISGAITLTLE